MGTKLPPESYAQLFEAAAQQEIGLHITCVPEDQHKLVNALSEYRVQSGLYDDFIISQPQPPGTIYISRKTVEMD